MPDSLLTVGDRATWKRRQRGGMRRVTDVPVEVVSVTPVGNYVVRFERRWRSFTAIVKPSSLEAVK